MLQLGQVTSALFISDVRAACSEELLRRSSVTQVINVSRQQPFPAAAVSRLQVCVYDDPAEDLRRHLDRCADAIQREALRGGRSLVYCKNGRSRSATVCAAYLMKHRGMTLSDALKVSR